MPEPIKPRDVRADTRHAMDVTIEEPNAPASAVEPDAPADEPSQVATDTVPPEESGEIRGMMPTFNVWQEAQHTLKFERAAATVARERERGAAKKRRWPIVAAIGAVILAAALVQRTGGGGTEVPTASTPVEDLPWQTEHPASRAFNVSMPADASSRVVSTVAGTGEELEARLPQVTVRVAAFEVAGPGQGRALIDRVLEERADALNATFDRVQGVGTRTGAGFESVLRATTPVGVVRVIIDGTMLYVIEVRGDIGATRTKQIYDRVVLSFAAGS
jgi:hypothetical protein